MAKRKRKSKKPEGKKVDGKKPSGKGEKKSKSAARNLVETIVIVAVLVLVIRFLLLEAFKIPSSSMEPTLIGDQYHGDRVLAWKPSVKWTTPERWSINVFVKHPDEYERMHGDDGDKNYIKRLTGLPGERVLIAGGDIFIQGPAAAEAHVARKPAAVQEAVWHAVYEGTHLEESWKLGAGLCFASATAIAGDAEGEVWARFTRNRYADDDGLITNLYVKRLRLRLKCPEEECGQEFKASIRTARTRVACPFCGREIDVLRDDVIEGDRPWYPKTRHEEVPVGDLRVSFDVTAEREGGLVLAELTRDDERYVARVPFGGGEAVVSGPRRIEARAPVAPFSPGEPRRISFAHVDQTVILAIDGAQLICKKYSLSWTERAGTPEGSSVRIGLEGASLTFTNLRIERDLHYLSRGSAHIVEFYSGERGRDRWRGVPAAGVPGMPPFVGSAPAVRTRERLAEDEYFFMGDNSPSSYDSRMWGTVAAKDMVGRAFFAFWPPHQLGWMR